MVSSRTLIVSAILTGLAAPALGHPGHPGDFGDHGSLGFAAGFAHPFGGLDHLLAMAAVGLWAIQQGSRRALILLPLAFVIPMAAGFALGLGGFALPGVEAGIALSVLILGLLVVFAVRLPLAAAAAVTALFALFHGHAHGTELPETDLVLTYVAGMVLATGLLHAAGLVAAKLAQQVSLPALTRAAGAACALTGLVILVG